MDGMSEPTWIEKFAAEKRRADEAEVDVRRLKEDINAADEQIADLRDALERMRIQKREIADLLLEIMAEQSFPGGPPARVAALIREALS